MGFFGESKKAFQDKIAELSILLEEMTSRSKQQTDMIDSYLEKLADIEREKTLLKTELHAFSLARNEESRISEVALSGLRTTLEKSIAENELLTREIAELQGVKEKIALIDQQERLLQEQIESLSEIKRRSDEELAHREQQLLANLKDLEGREQQVNRDKHNLDIEAARIDQENIRIRQWQVDQDVKEQQFFKDRRNLEKRAEEFIKEKIRLNSLAAELDSRFITDKKLQEREGLIAADKLKLIQESKVLNALKKQLELEKKKVAKDQQWVKDENKRIRSIETSQRKLAARAADIDAEAEWLRKKETVLDARQKTLNDERSNLRKVEKDIKTSNELRVQLQSALDEREVLLRWQLAHKQEVAGLDRALKECMARDKQRVSSTARSRSTKPEVVEEDDTDDSLPSIFRADSPLSKAGYTVSEKGQFTDAIKRHKLLADFCRSNDIPKAGNTSYMRQWGQGGSKKRVLCVAHHINWLINFQGAKEQNEDARSRWELDLKWLKKTYTSQVKKIEWP